MNTTRIERRVTPWRPLWFASEHYVAVRIWQEFDGRHWYQQHEWARKDGSTTGDGWIHGVRGWSALAEPTRETAPGDLDVVDLSNPEIEHLVELLDGSNHPLGISARDKLAAWIATKPGRE